MKINQKELWYADLNPTEGSEQRGFRPVVVISGNLLNHNTPLCIICPLTTKIKNYHGNVILEPNKKNRLQKQSEVLTFRVRSVAQQRLKRKIGKISDSELEQIKSCLQDLFHY